MNSPNTTLQSTNGDILRLPNVIQRTGLSRSSIYAFIKIGVFPKPIKIGQKAVGWLEGDIASWIDSRRAAIKTVGAK